MGAPAPEPARRRPEPAPNAQKHDGQKLAGGNDCPADQTRPADGTQRRPEVGSAAGGGEDRKEVGKREREGANGKGQ